MTTQEPALLVACNAIYDLFEDTFDGGPPDTWAAFGSGFEMGLNLALRHPEWAIAASKQRSLSRFEVEGVEPPAIERLLDAAVRIAPIESEVVSS